MRHRAVVAVIAVGLALLVATSAPASYIIQTAYNLVQNAGTPVARRATLNFTGGGVSVADTAGITTVTVPGVSGNYTQSFSGQTTVTLTDGLNTVNKIVQCYSSATPPVLVEPDSVVLTNANTTTVTFAVAQSGFCIVNGAQAASTTGNILTTSITLSSAQLLALSTTPVVLVPSPGAGRVIVPLTCWISFTAGTQYSNPMGGMVLGYGTSNVAACTPTTLVGVVTSATNVTFSGVFNTISSAVANTSLQFNKATANFTGGTGTLYYSMTYTVMPSQ